MSFGLKKILLNESNLNLGWILKFIFQNNFLGTCCNVTVLKGEDCMQYTDTEPDPTLGARVV